MNDVVRVLAEDPDLAEGLTASQLERAEHECMARAVPLVEGEWSPLEYVGELHAGIGLLVLEGMLVRRVDLADRVASELLGEGEVLRPWEEELIGVLPVRAGRWRVLQPGRLAVLDRQFTLRAGAYPEVISALVGRSIRRSRQLAVLVAIIHQPRIDVRVHMLLWQLATRWGNVHRDGVHLPLRLTHSMLAELVAARRPSVTKALGDLADRSVVRWTGESWLLMGQPPSELKAIEQVSVAPVGPGAEAA